MFVECVKASFKLYFLEFCSVTLVEENAFLRDP